MDNFILKIRISSSNLDLFAKNLHKNYGVVKFDKVLNEINKKAEAKYTNTIIVSNADVETYNVINKVEWFIDLVSMLII